MLAQVMLAFTQVLRAPEVLKSHWRQFRVPHGVLDIPVAEIGL